MNCAWQAEFIDPALVNVIAEGKGAETAIVLYAKSEIVK